MEDILTCQSRCSTAVANAIVYLITLLMARFVVRSSKPSQQVCLITGPEQLNRMQLSLM